MVFNPDLNTTGLAAQGMQIGAQQGAANQANYAGMGAGLLNLSGGLMRYNQQQNFNNQYLSMMGGGGGGAYGSGGGKWYCNCG